MSDIFYNLLTKNNSKIPPEKIADARKWYIQKARNISISNPKDMVIETAENRTRKISGRGKQFIGAMVMFEYNATTDDKLPYWDKYPLVFPFKIESSGFYGINMHYLPFAYRARLMDALYKYVVNDGKEEKARLQITYDILKSCSRATYIKPCVKHYLNKGVRSPFAIVPPTEWEPALFLPIERFQKAKTSVVHKDSIRIIRGK